MELAGKAGVSSHDGQAILFANDLKSDERCFSSRSVGKSTIKRYSHEALKRVRNQAKGKALEAARTAYRDHLAERRAGRRSPR